MLYRVSGVWLVSDRPGVLFLDAVSADDARAEGTRRGLKVSEVVDLNRRSDGGKSNGDHEQPGKREDAG